MKRTFCLTMFLLQSFIMVASADVAVKVSDVTARQRYPWNGMVDIDYTITGSDTEDTVIAVKVTDTDTARSTRRRTFWKCRRLSQGGIASRGARRRTG